MRKITLLLIFFFTMLLSMACHILDNDSAYLAMDPQQGWTYPVKFSLESPSGSNISLFLCLQFKYDKDYVKENGKFPVAVHMKNAQKIIVSDTVTLDFNNVPDKFVRIEQGYVSYDMEIRTGGQMDSFKQGSRDLSVTLSPVKDKDGNYPDLNSRISFLCVGFRKL